MKKIFVLAMLCVFSIVGVQAVEAKTPDNDMQNNRPNIEKQFEKKQVSDVKFKDNNDKKFSYDKKGNRFERNNQLGTHYRHNGNKMAHNKNFSKRGHKLSHHKHKNYYSHHNGRHSFEKRHSFYR